MTCHNCNVLLNEHNQAKHKKTRCRDCLNRERREQSKRQRQETLNHYGGKCACCGETRYEFLAFDHINGGGNQHRKIIGRSKLDRWLRNNNYPEGFRVLCHNCNQALGLYNYCPHQNNLTNNQPAGIL